MSKSAIKKIWGKNFQSIKDIELEFTEKGVFYIKGSNNIGKSALTHMIKVLFTNVSDNQYKEYIRDNTDCFSVGMEDFSGNSFMLSRGAVDYYEWDIDGESGRLDNTRGKVPETITEYANFYYEEKDKLNLNIRLDEDTIMFSKTTGQQNYRIMQQALGTENFLKAHKYANQEKRETKKQESNLEGYIEKEDERKETILKRNTKFESILTELLPISQTLKLEMEIIKEFDSIKLVIDSLIELRKQVENDSLLKFVRKDFSHCREEIEKLTILENISELNTKIEISEKTLDKITPFTSFDMGTLLESKEILNNLVQLIEIEEEKDSLSTKLNSKLPFISFDLKESLDNLEKIDEMELLLSMFQEREELETYSEKLNNNPLLNLNLTEVSKEISLLEELIKLTEQLFELKEFSRLSSLKKEELDEKSVRLTKFYEQFDICPFCSQTMEEGGKHIHG